MIFIDKLLIIISLCSILICNENLSIAERTTLIINIPKSIIKKKGICIFPKYIVYLPESFPVKESKIAFPKKTLITSNKGIIASKKARNNVLIFEASQEI